MLYSRYAERLVSRSIRNGTEMRFGMPAIPRDWPFGATGVSSSEIGALNGVDILTSENNSNANDPVGIESILDSIN